MKTLGIDLGTNSLGWAILDSSKPTEGAIVDGGVVIFEEGIKREKGNDSLVTPAAERRQHRMARRLKFRRRMRKFKILGILIDNGMCPLQAEELERWKKEGKYPVENRAFLAWLKSTQSDNPYCDRAAAASDKVPPDVLGRAIYHLAQRRGFKSSRKDAGNETEEANGKKQDERSKVKNSIAALSAILDQKQITLGQHFNELNQKGGKVRGCYTGRKEHYEKEFDAIANAQKMDAVLAAKIRNALFFQRPLRSQTHLIGKCPLEKKLNRCHVAHPEFEAFRAWSFVNTIRIVGEDGGKMPLSLESKEKLVAALLKTARYVSFSDLVKTLKMPKGTRFNYPTKKTVSTCPVTHQLNKVLGGDCFAWSRMVEKPDGSTATYTLQTAFDALMFFEDNDKLLLFAQDKLGLDLPSAQAYVKIVCREGYAQYSLSAIRRINPFLKKGVELSQAVFLAKIPDVIGPDKFSAHEDEIVADVLERNEDYRANLKVRDKDSKIGVVPLQTRLWNYMQHKWGLQREQFDTLYFRDNNTDDSYASANPRNGILPPVNLGMLRNPLVQRALTVLRKHVNFLRRSGRIDADTRIHVELARSVNDRNTRMAFAEWQKSRETARQNAVERMAEMGRANPSDTDILRYILWQEQAEKCLYTGSPISQSDLFTSAYDIEHTTPRCRSGNNSQSNLTLCEHEYNCRRKQGRLPSECDNYDEILARLQPWLEKVEALENLYHNQLKTAKNTPSDNPEAKARNRQKALATRMELNYWRDKVFAFTAAADRMSQGFLNRQLVDTGIMARHALALLRTVYPQTYPVNGTAVAWARQGWGIQSIATKKERTTHLHHAIDAMVVAGLDRTRFSKICAYCKDDAAKDYGVEFPVELHPFENFSQAVFDASERILVKHLARHVEMKQTRRNSVRLAKAIHLKNGRVLKHVPAQGDTARGQLHKESFYGCIQDPQTGSKSFVIRKPLDSTTFDTEKALEKIVDPAIREIVQEQVRQTVASGLAFKKAIDETEFHMPSGTPIKKVRIKAGTVSDPQQIRCQTFQSKHDYKNPYYVESGTGSNFRLALFQQISRGKPKIAFMADNLLDWAKRPNEDSAPHNQTELGQFLGYVQPGRLALLFENSPQELMDGKPLFLKSRLYKVVQLDAQSGRIIFCLHSEARASTDLSKQLKDKGKNSKGESSPDYNSPHELLRLSPGVYFAHMLFEGIHFDMDMAGKISFRRPTC
jgi:CRISPR-associated endonuclease Csn1